MTQEEKAKAYDEAIGKLRGMMPNWERLSYNGKTFLQDLIHIFPELKESEDERIRKKLIALIEWSKSYAASGITTDEAKEMITYLEKQGKQKPIIEMKSAEESLGIDSETYNIIVDECIYGEQKSSWSEEDEKMIRGLIVICDEWTTRHSFYPIENCEIEKLKNWLKSLKDRYTWKPSEEQMKALKHASNDCSIAFADMKILATLYEQLKALHRYEQDT